ncbi:MAG: glycosyltransferase family 4 protein [Rhodospirillaceae bacterium]|jgi:glycosyltransferase involved in cell wall biosynthesis|nr:glycosyltransferase family 4 protein [Rhodospirillaceae bacterium]MBT4588023.1 glycosyltransferase family 4 protein [Rhodospirillaceae bacterium]MBT7266096.1 glycosyltransferase family 4 protein [Rhodospirillaceae bacterium]
MKVAFYAPMKSPNSPVPSGDRRVARALIQALEFGGHDVDIATEFAARESKGVPDAQAKLKAEGLEIAKQLIAAYQSQPQDQRPDVWFTYHLYYKAMDWIGPQVCATLNIPYVAAEVSYASKRAGGPWDLSHQALGEIINKADAIIGLNSWDSACVLPIMADPSRLIALKPFMQMPPLSGRNKERAELISKYQLDPSLPILVTVAMMRDDAKLQSYGVLGEALKQIPHDDWQLLVVGDGPARADVETHLGLDRVSYLGELPEGEISPVLSGSDLFVWPAVNEAYGMAMLEAQACGLPVIAGKTGGVADIVRDQETGLLAEIGNAADFADKLCSLLSDWEKRDAMSETAIRVIRSEHALDAAAALLDQALKDLFK